MSTTILERLASGRIGVGAVALAWPNVRAALFSFAFVTFLAANSGAYWPTAWGWSALALLFVAALVLAVGRPRRPSPLELAFPALFGALFLWILLSSWWASSATAPVGEAERALVYVAGIAAALLVVGPATYRSFLGGVWAGTVLVSGYALLTRLLPDRVGVVDPTALNRLASPIGYWNALGIFAVMGTLLAVGLAAEGRNRILRMLAAASTLVLVPTLYLTFGRGPWIALGIGLAAMVALDQRRLRLVTVLALVTPWVVAGVWVASRSNELTHVYISIRAAAPEGHRLAWILGLLALGAALSMLVIDVLERRIEVPRPARLAYGLALWLAAIGSALAIFATYGPPWAIAQRAYNGFQSNSGGIGDGTGSLNERLLSFSGNGRVPLWSVAWDDARDHPWLGSGAGTYERYWLQLRPYEAKVRDAHSLYMEALGEVGRIGLALLALALAVPLLAAVRARRHPLTVPALAAYLAFVVHAGVDWDWEIPAVTLTALFCGVPLVVFAKGLGTELGSRSRAAGLVLALALAAFAFVGLRGNRAIAAGETAANNTEWAKSAADVRQARTWAPWSSRPWQILGEAQFRQGKRVAARASFRKALAKDPEDWSIWLDLAVASQGSEQRRAFAQATKLDPLSPEIASWRPTPSGKG